MELIFVVKLLSTIALFVVFFTIFGLSSIQKYMQGDILTVTRTEPNDEGLPPPAIMVCPGGDYGGAWKENCKQHFKNFTAMDACSRKHRFTLNETIQSTFMSKRNGEQRRAISQSSWTPTYTLPHVGTCYILKPDRRLLKSDEQMMVTFPLNTTKSYAIYLFDQNFFVTKQDNSVFHFLLLDNPMSKRIFLKTIFTSRMNRPELSCNSDQSYSYNQCVRNNLANTIGCRNPFDGSRQFGKIQSCNTTEEFVAHWNANFAIYFASHKTLKNITRCQLPCSFHHYSIVGIPQKIKVKGFSYISLFYASTDMTTSQEVLLFPFDSLVSEFGGALGLFLGFSFLGLLDIIQSGCTNLLTRLKIDQVTFTLSDIGIEL